MSWFLLALLAAVLLATADLLTKRYFSDLSLPELMLARYVGIVPTSLALLLLVEIPPLDGQFYLTVGLALPVEVAASFMYLRAIQVSPLALTQPFLAFTPLFALLVGHLVLGELPSWVGGAGLVVLALGAYGLNLHEARGGWLEPVRAIARERGSWMMLLVSALYGYTSVMGRRALLLSSPLFMGAVYPLAVMAITVLLFALSGRLGFRWLRRPGPLMLLALCVAGEIVCHFLALAQVQTAYMIAVKRMSPLAAVLWGAWLLGEGRLGQHLLASALMVAGALVIIFLG